MLHYTTVYISLYYKMLVEISYTPTSLLHSFPNMHMNYYADHTLLRKGHNVLKELDKDEVHTFQFKCTSYSGICLIELTNVKGKCHFTTSDTDLNLDSVKNSTEATAAKNQGDHSKTIQLSVKSPSNKAWTLPNSRKFWQVLNLAKWPKRLLFWLLVTSDII